MNTSIGMVRFDAPATIPVERLRIRYDREAVSWDRTLERIGFHETYRRLLAGQRWPTVIGRDVRVLDVGIGTGSASAALVEAIRRTGGAVWRVTGVDISPEMLRVAARNLAREDTHLDGVDGSAECLPFPDATFDIVVAAHVIEHVARPLRALAEIERVLRPGGCAVLMLTRCGPATVGIERRWSIQCARSRKLEAVLRDFGMGPIRTASYPGTFIGNLISFCRIAEKPPRR